MAIQNFEIGLTYAGRVNVETLTTLPNMAPASFHFPYSETVPTGDGGEFSRGSPRIEWRWVGTIPSAMVDALQTLCPDGSVNIYIRSRSERGAESTTTDYKYYTAKMVWPALDSYEYAGNGMYRDFILLFRNCVIYTPPS